MVRLLCFNPGDRKSDAHVAVNSVLAVCEAKPGIRTTLDLPRIVANFS